MINKQTFWPEYKNLLIKKDIKISAIPWYIQHAKSFVKTHSRLSSITVDSVTQYLSNLSSRSELDGWVVLQKLHAVQILITEHPQLRLNLDIDWAMAA